MGSHARQWCRRWWQVCRLTWRWAAALPAMAMAVLQPQDELLLFQSRLLAAVHGAARRTLGGAVCFPTGALVRVHPSDLPLFQSFRALVQAELDSELRRRTEGIRGARFDGCRVTATADPDVPRRCPVVRVDWLPATSLLPPRQVTLPLHPTSPPAASTAPEQGTTTTTTQPADGPGLLRRGAGGAWLVVRGGADTADGDRLALPRVAGEVITIGRHEGQRLRLGAGDARVSSRHAVIRLDGDHWVVEDLCSTNGTFVDGVRTVGPTALRPFSVIRVGRTDLSIETETGPSPSRRARHAAEPVTA